MRDRMINLDGKSELKAKPHPPHHSQSRRQLEGLSAFFVDEYAKVCAGHA